MTAALLDDSNQRILWQLFFVNHCNPRRQLDYTVEDDKYPWGGRTQENKSSVLEYWVAIVAISGGQMRQSIIGSDWDCFENLFRYISSHGRESLWLPSVNQWWIQPSFVSFKLHFLSFWDIWSVNHETYNFEALLVCSIVLYLSTNKPINSFVSFDLHRYTCSLSDIWSLTQKT